MIVVSVASGTSADGLDVGVVDLHLDDDGVVGVQIVDTWTADWPPGAARTVARPAAALRGDRP